MKESEYKINPDRWALLYSKILYNYCLQRVADKYIAEDLVQDTFFLALRGVDSYNAKATEKNWLFSILKHRIVDFYRKKSREPMISDLPVHADLYEGWDPKDDNFLEQIGSGDHLETEKSIERKELKESIYKCKDHLKMVHQQVFVLKYMDGVETDIICKVLNITQANYWAIIHRARIQMRSCLEKNLDY